MQQCSDFHDLPQWRILDSRCTACIVARYASCCTPIADVIDEEVDWNVLSNAQGFHGFDVYVLQTKVLLFAWSHVFEWIEQLILAFFKHHALLHVLGELCSETPHFLCWFWQHSWCVDSSFRELNCWFMLFLSHFSFRYYLCFLLYKSFINYELCGDLLA